MPKLNCFDKITELKEKYLSQHKEGMSEHEERELGTKIALDYHKQLHDDLNNFKKSIGVKPSTYSPHTNIEDVQKIHNEYQQKINEAQNELPFGKSGDIGISHGSQMERAFDVKTSAPERGEGVNVEQSIEHGKDLLGKGESAETAAQQFKTDGKISYDAVSLVRAKNNELAKATDAAYEKYGSNSKQYESAVKEERDWYNNNVKPMQTEWSKIGVAQQGKTDIDTGSFTGLQRAFFEKSGKDFSPTQAKEAKELVSKNKVLQSKVDELETKLIDETNKAVGVKEGKASIAQTGKAIADKIRSNAKLSRPGSFSAATPASLVWDSAVEVVAQAIEKGALVADAVAKGVEHIKNTEWYKGLSDDKKQIAEKEFSDWHNDQAHDAQIAKADAVSKKFIDKEGNKFTPEEAKELWTYAKENYLDKGVGFRDMIIKVANDTGLSFNQVSHAIVTPKTKPISDTMWQQRYNLQKNKISTQKFIDKQGQNAAIRKYNDIVNIFREETVFGHAGVFVGTHAGMTLMDLPRMSHTVKAFFDAYKFGYGKIADYQIRMEDLKNEKNYPLAQRSGLQNNPDTINNDAEVISSKLGKFSESGKRAFNAIKVLRQALFDSHYNSLSAAEKADPSSAVSNARLVNNATGATNLPLPNWFKEVTFAGGMEAARWGKLTRNPLQATSTAIKAIVNPKSATIGERVFAKVWARRVGTELATYAGLLTLNAALQKQFNDGKNPVNLTDPTQSDWLKMKIGNTTLDFSSGMLSTIHFGSQMAYQPFVENKKNDIISREGKIMFKYVLGKLSPFYSSTGEAILQHDYSGNTMPWSDAKPLHNYNHKMTWEEYAASKLPLPVAEGFNAYYESAHENGLTKSKLDNILSGFKYGMISGTTGFRAYETPEQSESKPAKPHHTKLAPRNYSNQ